MELNFNAVVSNTIKKTIFIVFIILNSIPVFTRNRYHETQNKTDTVIRTLLITEIIKTKEAYYIQAQDSVCYTIVSLKTKDKDNRRNVIKVGKRDPFIVTSYFPMDMIPRAELSIEVIINDIQLLVPIKGINILISSNLKGLYYAPPY